MRCLIQQAVHIPELDLYLTSTHRHDYASRSWIDSEGKKRTYAVDGGTAYCRRAGDLDLLGSRIIEWSLYEDDPFETVADRLLWGTRGKAGTTPLQYRPIASFELDHLQAILATQPQIRGKVHERVVRWWIARKEGKL